VQSFIWSFKIGQIFEKGGMEFLEENNRKNKLKEYDLIAF
jgi:hypothetical protein